MAAARRCEAGDPAEQRAEDLEEELERRRKADAEGREAVHAAEQRAKDLEKELAEQSKVALKMIYFFQVLPFYVLQFTSGMALGNSL